MQYKKYFSIFSELHFTLDQLYTFKCTSLLMFFYVNMTVLHKNAANILQNFKIFLWILKQFLLDSVQYKILVGFLSRNLAVHHCIKYMIHFFFSCFPEFPYV